MVLLLVFMQLRNLFAIAKFLFYNAAEKSKKYSSPSTPYLKL